jgi:hypothetical protein
MHAVSLAPSSSSWSHLIASVRFSLPCPPHMPLACVLREIGTPRSSLSSSFTRSAYLPHCPLSCTIAVALARSSSSSRSGMSECRSTSSLPGTTASPDSSSTSTARNGFQQEAKPTVRRRCRCRSCSPQWFLSVEIWREPRVVRQPAPPFAHGPNLSDASILDRLGSRSTTTAAPHTPHRRGM